MPKPENNHHLTEVLCAFWFNSQSNPWDITFFGEFFEKIKPLGYTEKQEQKGIQLKFDGNNLTPESNDVDSRMVFKDNDKGYAIIMAANFVSFHKLEPYTNWDSLINNQVKPGLAQYKALDLGNNLIQIQALYLNKYSLALEDKLSNYFNFMPEIKEFEQGIEKNLNFHTQCEFAPNLIQQIKLNTVVNGQNKTRDVFLECSCIATANGSTTWETIAQQAHDRNIKTFNSLTKE